MYLFKYVFSLTYKCLKVKNCAYVCFNIWVFTTKIGAQ